MIVLKYTGLRSYLYEGIDFMNALQYV